MMHVASVHFKCFRCFRDILQVLHNDVAKIDRDITHVAMGYTRMCSSVYSKCFICFKRMLQVLHLDVVKLDRDVVYIYAIFQVFSYICRKCFILMFAHVCNGYTRVFKFFLVFLKVF
jgi:hypothetical protein